MCLSERERVCLSVCVLLREIPLWMEGGIKQAERYNYSKRAERESRVTVHTVFIQLRAAELSGPDLQDPPAPKLETHKDPIGNPNETRMWTELWQQTRDQLHPLTILGENF